MDTAPWYNEVNEVFYRPVYDHNHLRAGVKMQLIAFKAINDFSIYDQMRASVQMK